MDLIQFSGLDGVTFLHPKDIGVIELTAYSSMAEELQLHADAGTLPWPTGITKPASEEFIHIIAALLALQHPTPTLELDKLLRIFVEDIPLSVKMSAYALEVISGLNPLAEELSKPIVNRKRNTRKKKNS